MSMYLFPIFFFYYVILVSEKSQKRKKKLNYSGIFITLFSSVYSHSLKGRYSTTPTTLFFAIFKLKGKTLHQAVEMDIDIARNLQNLEE